MIEKYCLDANIFISSWNTYYPQDLFPLLWGKLITKKEQIIIIKPIFDEIDKIPSTNRRKTKEFLQNEYPLRFWLEQNEFVPTPIDNDDESIALGLRKKYEAVENSKGINTNDTKLIAYAKNKNHAVVTYEAEQHPNKNMALKNYKIPIVCEQNKVSCITFIEFLRALD